MARINGIIIVMPTIAELGTWPGKGMPGPVDPTELHFDRYGLFGDRNYMFVEGAPHVNATYHKGDEAPPGHFTSLREDPEAGQLCY